MKKELATKEDLLQVVLDQIKLDIHCGDYGAVDILISTCSIENLIEYLPDDEQKPFKHLRNDNRNTMA